jgi:hypothetical protein
MVLSLTINSTTHPNRRNVTQPFDSSSATFLAGDELFIKVESTGWSATTTDVFCAIEVET